MKRKLKTWLAGFLVLVMTLSVVPYSAFAVEDTASTETSVIKKKQKSAVSYNLEDGAYLVSGECTVMDANGDEVSLDENNPVLTTPGDYTILTTANDIIYSQVVSLYLIGDVDLDGTVGESTDLSALQALTQGNTVDSAAEYAADLDNDETIGSKDLELMQAIIDETDTLDSILAKYHVPAVTYDYLGGDEVMPIVGFYGPYYGPLENNKSYDFLNDQTYQMIKDSGINVINYTVNRVGDGYKGLEYLQTAMTLGEKYGIGYFVNDFDLNPELPEAARKAEEQATDIAIGSAEAPTIAEIAQQISQYSYFENYLGTNVKDEPYLNQYEDPDAYGWSMVNNQLKYYDWTAYTMNQFTNNIGFINSINPANEWMYHATTYAEGLDIMAKAADSKLLSYTSYPFSGVHSLDETIDDTTITKDSVITAYEQWAYYYQGLWNTREAAAKYDIPFWTYVAAGGDFRDGSETTETDERKLPTEAETYWDVNNKLAFGAKGIEWFTALQPWYFSLEGESNDYDRNGLIGADGNPTPFYWYAQNINNHIAAIDHVLMKSTSTGIMAIGDKTVSMVESGKGENDALITSTDMLSGISGGGEFGAIVGCFDYKDTEAFYVVNQSVDETQEFTLEFANEYGYSYYVNAKEYNGYGSSLTLNIAPGEGVLVVLEEVSGFLAEPTLTLNDYYDVDKMSDSALIMHYSVAGGTMFQNLPEYLKGLDYLRVSSFNAVEATFTADGYAYILASEELVADLKAQGYTCLTYYKKADIMNAEGYYTPESRTQVSSNVYLLEKQVAYGETVTYGNGSNWAILMTALAKLDVTVTDLLADVVADDNYKVAQIGDSVAVKGSSGAGTFQNLPDYLNGLYFVQHCNYWPEVVTATASADCYFYVIVSDTYVTTMEEQGFKLVATFAKSNLINGWMSCSDTLYLFEKQVNWGESITYSSTYRSSGVGGWGTLLTSPTKLNVTADGLLANVVADDNYKVAQIGDGVAVKASSGAGTFQNLPDYLKGLYFVQHYNNWPEVVTATANTDCYFYVIVSDTYITNMTNQGFKLVDTLSKATIMNGWMSCSDTLYLFEKQMNWGESITYSSTYRSSGVGGWGTLLTSVNKLDIPASGLRVSVSGTDYTTGQLESGAILLHKNSNGDTAFTNVPEYLNGLYYVQAANTNAATATATMDCYVYLLADEDLVASLETAGFTRVAAYEKLDILSGYWANNSGFSSTLYLMEMFLESGESVSYGDGSNIVSLMTSAKKLDIPIEDYNGLLATLVADTGTCATGKLANGGAVMTGQAAVYQNLPDYLVGLDYTMNSTWQTVKATAVADCYFYVIASAANRTAMIEQNFKLVSDLSKAAIINGWMSCSDTLYLFEKQMQAGEEITYYATYLTNGTGGWGTLMTSIHKLDVTATSGMLTASCVTQSTQLYATVLMQSGAELLYPTLAGNTALTNVPDYLKGLYFVQPRGFYEWKATANVDGYAYVLTSEQLVDDLKANGFSMVASYAKEDMITTFGYHSNTSYFSDTLYLMEKEVAYEDTFTYGSTSAWATALMSPDKLSIPRGEYDNSDLVVTNSYAVAEESGVAITNKAGTRTNLSYGETFDKVGVYTMKSLINGEYVERKLVIYKEHDANADGKTNAIDLVRMKRIMSTSETVILDEEEILSADTDGDTYFTDTDVVNVRKALVGIQ